MSEHWKFLKRAKTKQDKYLRKEFNEEFQKAVRRDMKQSNDFYH